MKNFASFVAVVVLFCAARAFGADQSNPTTVSDVPTCNRVVIVEGDAPAKVAVGEIVRVTGSGPSGMVEITAKTEGPVKLVGTNSIRRVVNGGLVIGAMIREFEVKALDKGTAKITVTVNNTRTKTTTTEEFKIEIQ
jgi:hypothetical protein